MSGRKRIFRVDMGSLSLRERVILTCLLVLVVGFGADFLFNRFYLERSRELKSAVADAEELVRHHKRLLSREELIHEQYQKIESPVTDAPDSILTETEILRELSALAGRSVHVKNVVPRLGHHDGKSVMFVDLDLEGAFEAVVGYVEQILNEMPSEVSNLSLAPWSGEGGGVVCRLSIRVGYHES